MLPSLLQPDVFKKAVKKMKDVHKQETGNKQGQFDEKIKNYNPSLTGYSVTVTAVTLGTHIQLVNSKVV